MEVFIKAGHMAGYYTVEVNPKASLQILRSLIEDQLDFDFEYQFIKKFEYVE